MECMVAFFVYEEPCGTTGMLCAEAMAAAKMNALHWHLTEVPWCHGSQLTTSPLVTEDGWRCMSGSGSHSGSANVVELSLQWQLLIWTSSQGNISDHSQC